MKPGEMIGGKYKILEHIGSGGFALVYKCWDLQLRRFVAVKAIRSAHLGDKVLLDRFRDELMLTAQLQHEHIVQVYDQINSLDGHFCIVMQYVDGVDLKRVLASCKEENEAFPVNLAVYVVCEIAAALDYAHKKKDATGRPLYIVHRDVSPANILISLEGKVKLTDFGIAKAAMSDNERTREGFVMGKCAYMSPEQATGKVLDARSDIYALGIIMYEVFTGRRPFEGDSVSVILNKVARGEISSLILDDPELAEELKEIVLKALKKNPDKRYQSSSELYRDLYNYLSFEDLYMSYGQKLADYTRKLFGKEYEKQQEYILDLDGIPEEVMYEGGTDAIEGVTPHKERPAIIPAKKDMYNNNPNQPIPISTSKRTIPDNVLDTTPLPDVIPSISSKKQFQIQDILSKSFYKQHLYQIIGILLLLLILVGGSWLTRDFFFPPLAFIDSYPTNASIALGPYSGTTPFTLRKLQDGNYSMRLDLIPYKSLKYEVIVSDNGKKIEFEGLENHLENNYLFHLQTPIHINSVPEKSIVYINNKRSGITPCEVLADVGEDLTVLRLEYPGLEPMNTQVDLLNWTGPSGGLWHFTTDDRFTVKHILIVGTFRRKVIIETEPTGASILLDGFIKGQTPQPQGVMLEMGNHTLTVQKPDWNLYNEKIIIDTTLNYKYIALERNLNFISYLVGKNDTIDIHSNFTIIDSTEQLLSIDEQTSFLTPTELSVPAGHYTASFQYTGSKTVNIDFNVANTDTLVAEMEVIKPIVNIIVTDMRTEKPVKSAMIYIKAGAKYIPIGKTKSNGRLVHVLNKAGKYEFKVSRVGYRDIRELTVRIGRGQRRNLHVKLIPR